MKRAAPCAIGSAVAVLLLFAFRVPAHETLTTTVLFDREIVRLLEKHCVMCHAQNGLAFPLETYEQAWLQKRQIRASAIARHMPPWAAFPGYGDFINENRLTLREMQFLVSWVEVLGPRNAGTVFTNVADPNAARRQEVRAHIDFGHWHLGQPQRTLQLPPNRIEPHQPNQTRRTMIDTGLTAEQRLKALEYMPGDRRVVRAAFFTVQETGQWIGSWTPWYGFTSLPDGVAYRLPAKSHIVAEIHYQSAAEPVMEHGAVGLHFADQPSSLVSDWVLEAKQTGRKLRASRRLISDTSVLALWPEIPAEIDSVEVSARAPGGATEILLFAKDVPVDWPTPYIFKRPIVLSRGTELLLTAHYSAAVHQGSSVRVTIGTLAAKARERR